MVKSKKVPGVSRDGTSKGKPSKVESVLRGWRRTVDEIEVLEGDAGALLRGSFLGCVCRAGRRLERVQGVDRVAYNPVALEDEPPEEGSSRGRILACSKQQTKGDTCQPCCYLMLLLAKKLDYSPDRPSKAFSQSSTKSAHVSDGFSIPCSSSISDLGFLDLDDDAAARPRARFF